MSKDCLPSESARKIHLNSLALTILFLCGLVSPTAVTAESGFLPVISSAGGGSEIPVDDFGDEKAREIILSDLGNEPDDQMSLIRHLLYGNEIDVEGYVVTTSMFKHRLDAASREKPGEIFAAYAKVYPNLLKHDKDFPSPDHWIRCFYLGVDGYGMEALKNAPLSAGAQRIIAAIDSSDRRPLWVTVWGGANTLAQALQHIQDSRSPAELAHAISKLRIYAISDQDDAGPWIRKEFPRLFYVVSPTDIPTRGPFRNLRAAWQFRTATWTGISGEVFYRPFSKSKGADTQWITKEWLSENIQGKGPLGALYPDYMVIMEGDTPAWLGLVQNGLAAHFSPTWGGWGGRYVYQPERGVVPARSIFTQGDGSADSVTGFDGQLYSDDFSTIYRWRSAYQSDFSNRMDWTIRNYADANHAPHIVVNGVGGSRPLLISAKNGETLNLSAVGSSDPDGDALTYRWFVYREAGPGMVAKKPGAEIEKATSPATRIHVHGVGQLHVILAVTDNGKGFPMTRYRRIVLDIKPGD